jgi:hypothetical protein
MEQSSNLKSYVETKNMMKKAVFWVVSPCSQVEVHRQFRGPCCLHLNGDEAARTFEASVNFYQKTAIFGYTAVRILNPALNQIIFYLYKH